MHAKCTYLSTGVLSSPEGASVHYFNPGYEAAFLHSNGCYTPPQSVVRFREDLRELPRYIMEEGDRLLHQVPREELQGYQFKPWGWSRELLSMDLPSNLLPYEEEEMRGWASRRNTIEVVRALLDQGGPFEKETCPVEIVEESSLEALEGLLPKWDRWVVKEEFSSSGRGVAFLPSEAVLQRLRGRGRRGRERSKHLYLERAWPKQEDRGYEFVRNHLGKIRYAGPSQFLTSGTHYVGNLLRSSSEIEASWSTLKTTPSHEEYIERLTRALEGLPSLRGYSGPLGVDTIVYRDRKGEWRLHPCIELNVRPTMGWVALQLSERWRGGRGDLFFNIRHLNHTKEDTYIKKRLQELPPLYTLPRGELPSAPYYTLCPVREESQFVATLEPYHPQGK